LSERQHRAALTAQTTRTDIVTNSKAGITGGVDTHADAHVAAALSSTGGVLGTQSFPTTIAGYRRLLAWLRTLGDLDRVGIEGTGSYGAALARHLTEHGISVIEVGRPNRQLRRRQGKTDVIDAIAAARAVLSGEARATPKTHDGAVECLRALRVVTRSATKARTQALNQINQLLVTAPEDLRERLRGLPRLSCSPPARRSGSGRTTTVCPVSLGWRCASSPSAWTSSTTNSPERRRG